MATTIVNIFQSKVLNQLDTYNHTALATSIYKVSLNLTDIPPSGITVQIKQNSSVIASLSAPAAAQNHMDLQALLNCTVNDVIGVVIASSTPSDQGGNSFKAILDIRQGLV